jgi:hypothetical protein
MKERAGATLRKRDTLWLDVSVLRIFGGLDTLLSSITSAHH